MAERTGAPVAPPTTPLEVAPHEVPPKNGTLGTKGAPHVHRRWLPSRRVLLAFVAVLVVLGGATYGYRWWYDSLHYVSSDYAQISGSMVQVGALEAGRVSSLSVDIGDRVTQNQVIARLNVPMPVSATANGQPRLQFQNTEDTQVDVQSPISGVVVARSVNVGDTVPAGQTLVTVVDPTKLWVMANIDETSVLRVVPGQPVRITVDTLHARLPGRVVAIQPASLSTFALLPTQPLAGNYTKEVQYVPVKIEFTRPDPRLMIGTSVEVAIRVA